MAEHRADDLTHDRADDLAAAFEPHRPRLRVVAQRMLGTSGEADDVVQETWLRLARSAADPTSRAIDNLGGWLTTTASRLCLDQLRSRAARREDPVDDRPALVAGPDPVADPEQAAELADSVGAALAVVLDTLSPNERLAFVLHDLFGVPFDEVAVLLGASPAVARQYASRGRRRVRGAAPESPETVDAPARRDVVAAFLAAARDGEFDALLRLLAPDVTLRADARVVAMGGVARLAGPHDVATLFNGRARAARLALLDGVPGAAWWLAGELKVAFVFHVEAGLVTGVEQLGDPDRLADMVVEAL